MEAFLRPANMVDVHLDPSLFLYKNNTEDVVVQANPKILYLKGKGRKQPSQKISERSLKSEEETGTTIADFEGMTPTSAEMAEPEDEKPMLVSSFELNEDSTKATDTHRDFPGPEQMLVTQTNDFSAPFEARDDVFADSAENPFQFDDRITDPSTQLETVVPRQTTFDEFTTLLPEESNHSLAELIQKEEESLPHRKFIVERVLHVLSPNETMSPRLRTGDVRFLNAQNHFVQRDFIEENDADTVEEKPCKEANFCLNGGQCFQNSEGKPICLCETGFIGNNCEMKDACLNHACANNATCESVSEKIYKCNCRKGFAGVYCDFVCDLQCGNGECVEKQGNLMCKCNPGWKGSKCDIRPCRDIFNTCRIWKREGQCENQLTTFFDINCAASCEICTVNNETIEVVDFLGYNRKAYDVPIEFVNTTMYSEVISFSVAPTLMFKTPSINFTSISTNYFDPDDVHVTHGFLTIDQYTSDPNSSISLMSVSNLGAVMIEEGKMTTPKNKYDGPRLDLALKYNHIPDELKEKVDKITRAFTTRNGQLIQYITRELRSKTTKYTKTYRKIQDVDFS
ncbi:hypothetical protein WR25_02450 isoform C [Diploscapter pachys]|uniref:EGF-like domain-containing protein n=1 Tax=Diploscapter pachys TaxID=2018661 RepID=A0A2A2KKR5_9BILA|nr:hypothetical protein WR25_02450 isoform A [Diploscapter pachys]PAV74469.1 hypothetical protein WR25_02450 isoform B [Diploscapter pachys]PAV74470.1 hypothetical protein WR25_02450 isoform C [Diploscapter pachys]